jgi:hypothetical protein
MKTRFVAGSLFATAAAAVAAATFALASPARADDRPAATAASELLVQVELVDKNGETFTTQLALTEQSCGRSESWHGAVHHKLSVCQHPGASGAPVLVFDVEREARAGKVAALESFEVQSRLAPGKPTVIGKLSFADGSETAVRATVAKP